MTTGTDETAGTRQLQPDIPAAASGGPPPGPHPGKPRPCHNATVPACRLC